MQERVPDSTLLEWRSIHMLFDLAIFSGNYTPSNQYSESIFLTDYGTLRLQEILLRHPELTEAAVKLSFLVAYNKDTRLINLAETDFDQFYKTMDQEIRQKKLIYPWVFGPALYDKFHELYPYPKGVESINHADTIALLRDLPQGVFQCQRRVIGPFGILTSSEARYVPPASDYGLWHCPDPTCQKLHTVRLEQGVNQFTTARSIKAYNSTHRLVLPREFHRIFSCQPGWYEDNHLRNLPFLVGNSFTEPELQIVLEELIETYPSTFRKLFPKHPTFKKLFSGRSTDIARRLNKAKCLQLILLMPDELIVQALEKLVDTGHLLIPVTEVRDAKYVIGSFKGWWSSRLEFSQNGVRTTSRELPMLRLNRLVERLYGDDEGKEQLSWLLRHVNGSNLNTKIDDYIMTEDPKQIVKNLFMTSQKTLERAFQELLYGYFERPSSPEDEERLVNKILWKLGFDVVSFPTNNQLFWTRLDSLLESCRTYQSYTELEREQIRSVAVNFFVSLEEILDNSLSFITWALLQDHYANTNFKFNIDHARDFMAETLNKITEENGGMVYDGKGKNTLYPLIQGFRALAMVCSRELTYCKKRPLSGFPGYHGNTDLVSFPFTHKSVLLDMRDHDIENILSLLTSISKTLQDGNVCDIRNRLEHQREDFPTQQQIEVTCDAIKRTIDLMEQFGVCPLIYYVVSSETDSYKREIIYLQNYKGRKIRATKHGKYKYSTMPEFQYSRPVLIIPSLHIGNLTEILRFDVQESSGYVEVWSNYPRRPEVRSDIEEVDVSQLATSVST